MKDFDEVRAGLNHDDAAGFTQAVKALFEWHRTTRDSWRNQRCVGALLDVVRDPSRPLDIRLAAVDALTRLEEKPADEMRRLIGLCLDRDEPLRLRWAALDILETELPEMAAQVMQSREGPALRDRSVDPDCPPPVLDVDAEIGRIAARQAKSSRFYPLYALLLFGGIFGTALSHDRPVFPLLLIGWGCLLVAGLVLFRLLSGRCPACRRFFAAEKIGVVGGYDGPSQPVGSTNMGASPVHTRQRVSVQEVSCRFCRHRWIRLR